MFKFFVGFYSGLFFKQNVYKLKLNLTNLITKNHLKKLKHLKIIKHEQMYSIRDF